MSKNNLKMKILMAITTATLHLTNYAITSAEDVMQDDPSNNEVELNQTDDEFNFVYAGGDESNTSNATKNVINIRGGNYYGIFGGISSTGKAQYNIVNIYDGNVKGGVTGGVTFFSYDSNDVAGDVKFNTVNILGGTIDYVTGGEVGYEYPSSIDASYDLLNTYGGDVEENIVNISGGTINQGVIGGSALTGSAIGNKINISGGTLNGEIIAAEVRYPTADSKVTDNSISISGSPDLSNASLIGGILGEELSPTGNSLNINSKNISVLNVAGFENINFLLPNVQSGDYILNLTGGTTDFSSTNMNVAIDGSSNVKNGDSITLIKNSNGMDINGLVVNGQTVQTSERAFAERFDEENLSSGTISRGITEDFDIELNGETDSSGLVTSLNANLSNQRVNDQINALPGPNSTAVHIVQNNIPQLPESPIDMMAEFNSSSSELQFKVDGELLTVQQIEEGTYQGIKSDGTEFTITKNSDGSYLITNKETGKSSSAENVVDVKDTRGYEIYIHMGGGHMKYKTGNGSYVKTNSGNYDLGFARKIRSNSGIFVYAPVIEYGHSNFDSFTPSSVNDINGTGHSKYLSGGLLFRNMNRSGFYYEGSFRGGKSDTKFASGDFLQNGNKINVSYHTEAPMFMGHARIGNVYRIGRNNLLDAYAIYAYARQGSTDTNLSSGEHYDFSSVDSSKIRIGYRMTTQVSKLSQIYSGLAYQYENSADSHARTGDISTRTVGSKGSSGMIEFGWLYRPLNQIPWAIDFNATGWIGHQEGFKAMAKLKRAL